jgi:hypothetical protein
MEREISFRGKGIFDGEWAKGFYTKTSFGMGFSDSIIIFNGGSTKPFQVIPETVSQFTGLIDINGVKIFEKDIVKVRDPYNMLWSINGSEVIFSYEYVGGWVISNGKENLNLGTRTKHIEVIGNVYDNPELLNN